MTEPVRVAWEIRGRVADGDWLPLAAGEFTAFTGDHARDELADAILYAARELSETLPAGGET